MAFPKSPVQPICVNCGGKIAKYTDRHYFGGSTFGKGKPVCRTRTEAQRHLNQPIVSVSYTKIYDDDVSELKVIDRTVSCANTWDGESYVDLWFCNGTCRTKWAYKCAQKAWPHGHAGINQRGA